MKKTTICLTALFVCCSMLIPTAAADKLNPEIGGEDLSFVEHDTVTGKDTTFSLDDLDSTYASNSVGSVSHIDSVNGGCYTEPTDPEWMQSGGSMNPSSGEDAAEPDKIISGSPFTRVTNVNEAPYCKNTIILCRWDLDDGSSSYAIGTGFMVGQKVMVTAGHLIWDKEYQSYPTEIRIFTRYDKGTSNYRSLLTETGYYHPQKWVLSSNYVKAKPNTDFDWCYITLFTAVGKNTGTYGMSSYEVPKNKEIILSGYPCEYTTHPEELYHQYKSSGVMNKINEYTVKHTCSTRRGQSGSALSSVNYVAWGIHTAGIDGTNYNGGVRFAPYLYELIINKINSTNE